MSDIVATPDDDEVLAAELALGLIAGEDARDAQYRVAHDADFANVYRRWQDRAAALTAGPDVTPSRTVWAAIEAQLPANDTGPSQSRLRWWQASTVASLAAALLLAAVAVQKPRTIVQQQPVPIAVPQTAPLVAVLTGKDKATGKDQGVVTISFDAVSGRLTSAPSGLSIGNHAPQLWVIPPGGKPRSLGLIARSAPGWTAAPTPARPVLVPGATLAISVEPLGGSPTGQPTGAVILTGTINAIG